MLSGAQTQCLTLSSTVWRGIGQTNLPVHETYFQNLVPKRMYLYVRVLQPFERFHKSLENETTLQHCLRCVDRLSSSANMWRAIPVRLGVGKTCDWPSNGIIYAQRVSTFAKINAHPATMLLCRCMKWVSRLVLAPLEQFGKLSIPSDGLNFDAFLRLDMIHLAPRTGQLHAVKSCPKKLIPSDELWVLCLGYKMVV